MKRLNLELDDQLVKKIDNLAGFGKRSEWIRVAIEEKLKRCKKK